MTVQLHSYISFKDNTREAMEFYKSVFGGEIELSTFEQYDSPEMPVSAEDKDKIMHAMLKGDNGIQFMAADTPSTMMYDSGSHVSLTLSGDDEEKLRGYWDKLSDGANITLPINKSPWGDIFGMLTDKYGVGWMVDISVPQNSEQPTL